MLTPAEVKSHKQLSLQHVKYRVIKKYKTMIKTKNNKP